MEHAPLRPVPSRPAGPVEPAAAVREVGAWLPMLPPHAARALALVVLAERPRAEVAATLEASEAELRRLLAAARKELRQTVVVLGGSGWCERAEGLISDRLDGTLTGRDARRLDVHLRNCPRCVEHERRLVQATDALIGGLGGFAGGPGAAEAPAGEAPGADEPPPLEDATPADEPPPLEEATAAEEAPPEETTAADDGTEEGEAPAARAKPPAAGPPGAPAGGPARAPAPSAIPPGATPRESQVAAAAEVLVTKRTRGQIAAAIVWNSLIGLAILLTLTTIALTIAGILGAEL